MVPSLIQKKIIPAKRADVFDAWTTPEIMQQWFFPGAWSAESETDVRIGGAWRHEMVEEAGERYLHTGEYLEIKRPEKLVFTWNSPFVQNTRVTIELRDLGNSTELTLTHEFLPNEKELKSHTDGWTGCLNNLQSHFSN